MQIKILFDNIASDNRFSTGWGVSYLVNDRVLFDTGEKSYKLLRNMKNIGITLSGIEAIVISHEHWDHTGGLRGILKENPKPKVYICPHFSRRFKNRVKSYGNHLIEVDKITTISKNIYITGETEGTYNGKYMPEQALVLNTNKGLMILTGCAHPGIIKIIENVKKSIPGSIYLVLGGFHLMGKHKKTIESIVKKFRQLGIKKVSPSHCTGKLATTLFRKEYNSDCLEVKVGQTVEI